MSSKGGLVIRCASAFQGKLEAQRGGEESGGWPHVSPGESACVCAKRAWLSTGTSLGIRVTRKEGNNKGQARDREARLVATRGSGYRRVTVRVLREYCVSSSSLPPPFFLHNVLLTHLTHRSIGIAAWLCNWGIHATVWDSPAQGTQREETVSHVEMVRKPGTLVDNPSRKRIFYMRFTE